MIPPAGNLLGSPPRTSDTIALTGRFLKRQYTPFLERDGCIHENHGDEPACDSEKWGVFRVTVSCHRLICTTFAGGNPLKYVEEAME